MSKKRNEIRWAVVGLGWFAQEAVLPAFASARKSKLSAIVSDDPEKLSALGKRHHVEHAVDYDGYDALLRSGEIDAVYLVVPNAQHCDFALRTLKHGVPLLVEKPMAVTEEECRRMTRAAESAGVPLMVGYRLHFEKANLSALELVRSGKLGELRTFSSVFTMQVEEGNTRLRPASEGGGPVYDIGTYCINAARTFFGTEPVEVAGFAARPEGDERFAESDEQVTAMLRFPGDRLATFSVGFGHASVSRCELLGTKGRLVLEPAFSHTRALRWELDASGEKVKRSFPKRDQVAPEISYFARCILEKKAPEPGALEGLLDVRVIEQLGLAIDTKRPISLPKAPHEPRPHPDQEDHAPAKPKRELVNAEAPHD